MSENAEQLPPPDGLSTERIESELVWLRERVIALTHGENDSVGLRACKLYYDMLCDAEAIGYETSRQQGRPLQIIFRGMDESA